MGGFQQLDINQVGSFKQHMINQENLSDAYYKENYENEKDLVYFPQTVTQTYENQKKNAEKNFSYDKDAKKKGERHEFNLAESETYKVNQEVIKNTRDREYTKKWEEDKIKVKPAAVSREMELQES